MKALKERLGGSKGVRVCDDDLCRGAREQGACMDLFKLCLTSSKEHGSVSLDPTHLRRGDRYGLLSNTCKWSRKKGYKKLGRIQRDVKLLSPAWLVVGL